MSYIHAPDCVCVVHTHTSRCAPAGMCVACTCTCTCVDMWMCVCLCRCWFAHLYCMYAFLSLSSSIIHRNKATRTHLKNVYAALALTMLSAGAGALAFFFTGFMVRAHTRINMCIITWWKLCSTMSCVVLLVSDASCGLRLVADDFLDNF